tara:strand:- start:18120 stop:20081 length:1962 start_codon:yes stop_codon:yes gene_type:complete
MAMTEDIRKELEKDAMSPFHQALFSKCNELLRMSYDHMQKFYTQWDKHGDTVAGLRTADKEDNRAAKIGAPEKMTVPLSRAQIHTLTSFLFLYFQQRQYAFEYQPQDYTDYEIREICEKMVHRDCYKSNWSQILYQWILDCARFNIGVIEHTWCNETEKFPVTQLVDQNVMGFNYQKEEETLVDVPVFQGNKLYNISPYRFFPDPRHSLTRMQEGEFVAVEDEMSRAELYKLQNDGYVAGMQHVVEPDKNFFEKVRGGRRHTLLKPHVEKDKFNNSKGVVNVTRMQIKLIPSKFEYGKGKKLGTETYPVQYIVWIANNQRIIRAEPSNYLHRNFTVDIGQFDPDIHHWMGEGLAGTIDKLQSTVTWFVNTRILSVRRNLDHQLIFDPNFIDSNALKSRAPMVPLKRSTGRKKLTDAVMQLQMGDVTSGHMTDAQQLIELTNLVTGVNESAMGAIHGGRRSASEHRAANQGASARMRMIGANMFNQGLKPLAHKLLMNLRQGIEQETFERAVGRPNPADATAVAQQQRQWELFKADPAHLAAGEDHFVLDTINPTEKVYMAQSLSDLFKVIMSSPEAATAFDIDPKGVWDEIMELRGAGDLRRHSLRDRLIREQQANASTGQGNQNQQGQGGVEQTPPVAGTSPDASDTGVSGY